MGRVLILSEVKQRELPAANLLSYALESLGHEVRIVASHLFPTYHIDRYKPDLIFNNGMRINRDYLRFIKYPKNKFGTKIATAYAEQISADLFDSEFYNHASILRDTDAHLVWGKAFASKLLGSGNVVKEKIYLVGSHRLDVSFILKNSINKENFAQKYGLNPKKPWVLITSNIIVSRTKDKKLVEYTKVSINAFNKGIQQLAGIMDMVEFIYRPHPASPRHQSLIEERELKQCKNVHFIGEEALSIWLSLVDMMIVWQSTSAIDAWAAKVPVIAFEPIETPEGFEPWHVRYLTKKNSVSGLAQLINTFIYEGVFKEDNDLLTARNEFIKQWYGEFDGRSYIRMACVLNQLLKANVEKINNENRISMPLKKIAWSCIELYKGLNDILLAKNSYIITQKDISTTRALFENTKELQSSDKYRSVFNMGECGWNVILTK